MDEGLVDTIGVSNFNEKEVQSILDVCRIRPAVNQVGANEGGRELADKYLPCYCCGIQSIATALYAGGMPPTIAPGPTPQLSQAGGHTHRRVQVKQPCGWNPASQS